MHSLQVTAGTARSRISYRHDIQSFRQHLPLQFHIVTSVDGKQGSMTAETGTE